MDRDALVAEPARLTRWTIPVVFVVAIIRAWYLWNAASHGASVPADAWFLPALGILVGPLWLVYGNRRVVMDRASVSEYRGIQLVHRFAIRDLTAIRSEMNAMKLVFAGGGTITIPTIWPGAKEILHHLQSVADSRSGEAPPMDDWLPLNYLSFPPRCIACGSRDAGVHRIFAGTRYHVPGVSITRGGYIAVPACSGCSGRRKVMGFVGITVAILVAIGVVAGAIFASERFPNVRVGPADALGTFLLPALAVFFALIHFMSNGLPRWIDRRVLGVAALGLSKEQKAVRLWFRDRQLELEVHTLTSENRSREIARAAGLAAEVGMAR